MSAPDRRRVRAELEAEKARLDLVHDVLTDMVFTAADVSEAKGYRDSDFEMSRTQHVGEHQAQVHAERTAVWDRLLDYRHDPALAAKIRAQIAADRDRARRERSRGIERSR
ncbi:hypothetical protein [Nocardia niwae]|uniref:hypothetical protein n=1 Tax=Nocardia niwae TaxID=626084 RepID=UPI0007A4DCD1|nr:hypothetical protein [Nocardia niwae]